MAKTYEGLKADANIIKNEIEVQKNTATRVGTMFVDVIDKMEESDETQLKLSSVLKVLPTKYSNDDFHKLIDSVTEQAFYQGYWGAEKYMLDCVVHKTSPAHYMQCIYGNLNVDSSNTKRLIVSNKYRIIRRYRYEGTWSKWEVIADAMPQEGYRRKVLLLGDSQVAMCKSSNYTLEGLIKSELKTDVYNFGFAGSRWAFRDDEGNTPFNAFSVLNVIRTLCSKDYSLMNENVNLVGADYTPSYTATLNRLKSFLSSIDMDDGSDWAIIISAGGNDFGGKTPLTDDGDYTLYGAMGSALSQLCSTFPALLVHIVSPTFRMMTDGSTSDEYTHWINPSGQMTRWQYGDAIREYARDKFRLPTYDIYRNGGRNAYNIESLSPDGVHPTSDAGVKSTADIYVKILNTL